MDIKCNLNPYYFGNNISPSSEIPVFTRAKSVPLVMAQELKAGLCEDKFVRRPVATKSATGLLGLVIKCKNMVSNYMKNYKKNLAHTYDHKVIFALIEKEIFGRNSIDSLTHDLDKLVLYVLGFPKSIVSKFHRQISVHHAESGKQMNLRSMLCDNIASSPEFKPEKKKSLREHYHTSQELQSVEGFEDLLERYNYGENLDFEAIKSEKNRLYDGYAGLLGFSLKAASFIFANVKISGL